MNRSTKTFLKFVANTAIVLLLVAVVVPSVYRATKKVPGSSADVSSISSASVQNISGTNFLILTFDSDLPTPNEATAANCDLNGSNEGGTFANTCYKQHGVTFLDNSTQATVSYVARGTEFVTNMGGSGLNNTHAVLMVTDSEGLVTPNASEDTFALGVTNFTGQSALIGTYNVGCSGNCSPSDVGTGVSNVQLIDLDETGSGLDGRDYKVQWEAKGSTPAGYVETRVYIVTAVTNLTTSNVSTNGCGGGACADRGRFNQYSQTSHQLFDFESTDSSGTAWNGNNNMKACVFIDATTDTLDCSPGALLKGDTVADTDAPFIEHFPVHTVIEGAPAVMHALVFDEQTTDAEFTDSNDATGYVDMYHGEGNTEVKGADVSQADGVYTFTTASNISGSIDYYFQAGDSDGNLGVFTKSFGTAQANASSDKISATAVSAGSNTVTVTVQTYGGSNVSSAYVFLAGLGKAGAVTNGSGVATLSNVPDGGYEIIVAKTGHCSAFPEFVNVNGANVSKTVQVNDSACQHDFAGEGEGGFSEAPFVMFTSPEHNFAPADSIRIGYNQALNSATVNDADPTDAGSNIILYDSSDTKIGGSVVYCSDNTAPGCGSLFSGDTNVILFDPTSELTAGGYVLEINGGVTSEKGIPAPFSHFFNVGQGEFAANDISTNFGQSGAYMPPFVSSMAPAPGISLPQNGNLVVQFNEAMKTSTITNSTIQLVNLSSSQAVSTTVTLDNNDQKTAVINPASNLSAGEYELRVLGSVANANNVPMIQSAGATDFGFVGFVQVGSTTDSTAPTAYFEVSDNDTGIATQKPIEIAFSEPLDPNTAICSNITFTRGNTAVTKTCEYDPGGNTLIISPSSVLAPNTAYTLTLGTSITDANGVALASTSRSFTTGASDTKQPKLIESFCDDYGCKILFSERMNAQNSQGDEFANSVLNHANLNLTQGGGDLIGSTASMLWDALDNAVLVEGLSLTADTAYTLTVGSSAQDIAGNAIVTASSANVFQGKAKDSAETFGDFGGGGGGMFGPPGAAGISAGQEFMPSDFGGHSVNDKIFGGGVFCFPFVGLAGADSNVFHCDMNASELGGAIQDGDQFVFTFPKGTTVTNAAPDTFSPAFADWNEFGPGKVEFDTAFSSDGVSSDNDARTVTVQANVASGTPGANDHFMLDLAGITNPSLPKGPDTGGYTVSIKHKRSGAVIGEATSSPYFIDEGGSNSITLKIYAGSTDGVSGANGSVYVFGGGPSGPLDMECTLTDGKTTACKGTAISSDAGHTFSSLPDGCYHIGTDPFATLGGVDYFGQDFPEPICVSGGETKSKNVIFTSAAGSGNSVTLNVSIVKEGTAWSNQDIDIFGGCEGGFVVKTLENQSGNTINSNIKLRRSGFCHIGVGPAMPKGSQNFGGPDFDSFGGTPPPPIDLEVDVDGETISAGFFTPRNVSFNDDTDTVTFTIKSSNINVPVKVVDGDGNGLANAEVFFHSFAGGAFGTTDNAGEATLKVAEYGPGELGVWIPGVGERYKRIDVRNESGTKIYDEDGQVVSTVNVKVKKRSSLTISGKVLDADGNAIAYAPVWAQNANGDFMHGGTDAQGAWSFFADAGTWTVRSELPPSETEACGEFSKTITVTTESKSNQNITPTESTCYTLSGSVTVGNTAQANTFVFVEEWDTDNDRPSGGFHRGVSTDSTGAYQAKVPNGTYRVGTFDPDFGELSTTTTVSGANKAANLSSGTLGTATVAFGGGTISMNGFIELKKVGDRHTRFSKAINGTDSNLAISVPEGTYNYSLDLFGVGFYSGTVATGATATIDLSSTSLNTVSGTIKDDSGNALANTVVELFNTSDKTTQFAQTDADGAYSLSVKDGTYEIRANRAGYTGPTSSVSVNEDVSNLDFGGDDPDFTALAAAGKTIGGTLYQSDGSTPVEEGFVIASYTDSDGKARKVSSPVDPTDGTYTLQVPENAAITVKAKAPKHAATEAGSAADTSTANVTGHNITLTADATKTPASATSTMSMSTGGKVDDSDNSSISMNASAGAIEAGNGTAKVALEKNFTAPESDKFTPVGDIAYDVNVTNSSTNAAIKNFDGNVEFTFAYSEDDLPAGQSESELEAMWYSNEAGSYKACESGSVVDTTNNTITCVTNHATTFAVVYPASSASSSGGRSFSQRQALLSDDGAASSSSDATVDTVNTNANTSTHAASNTVRTTLHTETEMTQPLEFETRMIKQDTATGERTVALTADNGSLTLKPNADATVSVRIPGGVELRAQKGWQGDIQPPLVQSKEVIQEGDYEVEGDRRTLTRDAVETVISVGSSTSPLTFSAPVAVEIPVSLEDGVIVEVYSSEDGVLWELVEGSEATILNGRVNFNTDHFTYFAVVPTGEVDESLKGSAEEVVNIPLPFIDMKKHWSKEYVQVLYNLGVIGGKTSKIFAPNATITRAELAKMALLAFNFEVPEKVLGKPFLDVKTTDWFAPFVQAAKDHGVIEGYANGGFSPNSPINRAEALKILFEAAGVEVVAGSVSKFKDVAKNAWYFKYVDFATKHDMIAGYGSLMFRPGNNINRAEVSKVIVKIMELLDGSE